MSAATFAVAFLAPWVLGGFYWVGYRAGQRDTEGDLAPLIPPNPRSVRAVEAGARALREHRNTDGIGDPSPWDTATDHVRRTYLGESAVVLLAADTHRRPVAGRRPTTNDEGTT